MKFKELLTVLDSNAYLNIVSEKGQRLYEGKVIFYYIWFTWKND